MENSCLEPPLEINEPRGATMIPLTLYKGSLRDSGLSLKMLSIVLQSPPLDSVVARVLLLIIVFSEMPTSMVAPPTRESTLLLNSFSALLASGSAKTIVLEIESTSGRIDSGQTPLQSLPLAGHKLMFKIW